VGVYGWFCIWVDYFVFCIVSLNRKKRSCFVCLGVFVGLLFFFCFVCWGFVVFGFVVLCCCLCMCCFSLFFCCVVVC